MSGACACGDVLLSGNKGREWKCVATSHVECKVSLESSAPCFTGLADLSIRFDRITLTAKRLRTRKKEREKESKKPCRILVGVWWRRVFAPS